MLSEEKFQWKPVQGHGHGHNMMVDEPWLTKSLAFALLGHKVTFTTAPPIYDSEVRQEAHQIR
jgi:hypothetical protein